MRVISNFILEQLKENPDVIKIPAEQFGTASLLSYFGDLLPFASLAYEVGNVLLSQNHFQKCSLQKHSHSLATYLTEAFSLTSQQAIRITEQLIGKIVHHRGLLDETILHKSFEEVDTKTLLAISNKWLRETNMASINWEKMAYVVITNGVAYAIPGGVAAKLMIYGTHRFLSGIVFDDSPSVNHNNLSGQEKQTP